MATLEDATEPFHDFHTGDLQLKLEAVRPP
jgi:hypothetical protein